MTNQTELPRNSDGTLARWAWPGGYPLYYVTKDGGILCASDECANGPECKQADNDYPDDDQWNIIAADIHWEGEPLLCDHCGTGIDSAYGIPS